MRLRSSVLRWSFGTVAVLLLVFAASAQVSPDKPIVDQSEGMMGPGAVYAIFEPGSIDIQEQLLPPVEIKPINSYTGPEASLAGPRTGSGLSAGAKNGAGTLSVGPSMMLSSSGADRGARAVTPADVLGELEKLRGALGL